MKILVDTNFFLTCVKQKIQVFEFLKGRFSEILLPRGVVDELVKISQSGGPRERSCAEVVLQLIALHEVTILPLEGYVDQQILNYVRERKGIAVATLDKSLQRILRGRAKMLIIRGRKKLEMLNR